METASRQKISVHIRWMNNKDIPKVLAIEEKNFEFPLSEKEIRDYFHQTNHNFIGMVAEFQNIIVGFMIYELDRTRIDILDFAVHLDFCRRGVGRQMTDYLIKKLHPQKRTKIFAEIRESNLTAQLFFRKMGFLAICIVHNPYEVCPDEDTYLMQYLLKKEEKPIIFRGVNRINPFLV